MKSALKKWDEELKKKNEMVRQVWIETQKEILARWLEDLNTVLCFAEEAPTYIPSVKEQWQIAVRLKPSTTLGDLGAQPKEMTQPSMPQTIQVTKGTKPTARKSVARQTRTTCKSASLGEDPENGNKPGQADDDQPEDLIEEPQERPTDKKKPSGRSAARESLSRKEGGLQETIMENKS